MPSMTPWEDRGCGTKEPEPAPLTLPDPDVEFQRAENCKFGLGLQDSCKGIFFQNGKIEHILFN